MNERDKEVRRMSELEEMARRAKSSPRSNPSSKSPKRDPPKQPERQSLMDKAFREKPKSTKNLPAHEFEEQSDEDDF